MTELTLTAAQQFLAIEEIKRVFAMRLRYMDTKQWDLYPTVHTDDVVSETFAAVSNGPAGDGRTPRLVVGNQQLTRAISQLLDGPVKVTSVHHGHTPEIELTGDTTARGVWAMEDRLWWTNGDHDEHLHGYGHYHEEYRNVNGRWLISHRTLSRLRVDVSAAFFDFLRRDAGPATDVPR